MDITIRLLLGTVNGTGTLFGLNSGNSDQFPDTKNLRTLKDIKVLK